jgi:hypothetical protein
MGNEIKKISKKSHRHHDKKRNKSSSILTEVYNTINISSIKW